MTVGWLSRPPAAVSKPHKGLDTALAGLLNRQLLREAPTHALMIVVMAVAMVSGSALASMAGAGLLLAASVMCAALSRGRPFLREHVVDLWAMALVLIVFLPQGATTGHHAMTVATAPAFAVVTLAWAGARLALARGLARRELPMPVASALLTAAGLALMAALCA